MKCLIFKRWGKMIASFVSIFSDWKGTVDGRPASEDIYVYFIYSPDVLLKTHQSTGMLSLIR